MTAIRTNASLATIAAALHREAGACRRVAREWNTLALESTKELRRIELQARSQAEYTHAAKWLEYADAVGHHADKAGTP